MKEINNISKVEPTDITTVWSREVAGQNSCNPPQVGKGDSRADEIRQPKERQNNDDPLTIPGISTKPPLGDPRFGGGHISTGKVMDPGFGGGHIEFPPIPGFGTTPKTTGKGHEY